jgi:hypothetical protein
MGLALLKNFAILKIPGYGPYKPVFDGFKVFFMSFRYPFGKPFLSLPLGGGFACLPGGTTAGIGLGLVIPETDIPDGTRTRTYE